MLKPTFRRVSRKRLCIVLFVCYGVLFLFSVLAFCQWVFKKKKKNLTFNFIFCVSLGFFGEGCLFFRLVFFVCFF